MFKLGELKVLRFKVVKRDSRVTALIENKGKRYKALLRNTGRLSDIIYKGAEVLAIKRDMPGKTEYAIVGTLVDERSATLIDTYIQMKMFEEAVKRKLLPWLSNCEIVKREVKVRGSRLDYMLSCNGFLEVKSAVYYKNGYAMYPDTQSKRGLKHIRLLLELKLNGFNAFLAFIAAHPLAIKFRPCWEVDEKLALGVRKAYKLGVEVRAIKMHMSHDGKVYLDDPDLPIDLESLQ